MIAASTRPWTDVPHFVYRHFDSRGELLYVGCTNSVAQREQTHQVHSWWWPAVASTRNLLFPTREKALSVERHAIWAERPKCNVKGRWYRADSRVDWTASDYLDLHYAALRAAKVIGPNTAKLLAEIEHELLSRHGVIATRGWRGPKAVTA